MATFVLVHGSFSGGWIWKRVRTLLMQSGHTVFTPTLTGVGERAHLAASDITLDTHIQDIVGVLSYEDLDQVILVGHSYGGMVITGVAERCPERLAHLVYLDAAVPQDGQSEVALMAPARRAQLEQQAQSGAWQLPVAPVEPTSHIGFGGASPVEQQTLLARRVPQPLLTHMTVLTLSSEAAAQLPRTFIYCTDKAPDDFFRQFADRAKQDARWHYAELPTNHFPHLTMPQELVTLLLQVSDRAPVSRF